MVCERLSASRSTETSRGLTRRKILLRSLRLQLQWRLGPMSSTISRAAAFVIFGNSPTPEPGSRETGRARMRVSIQKPGGPPATKNLDGTVVPCAAAGSLMFVPEIPMPAVRAIKRRFGDKIYQHYGFVDAFNPNTGWQAPDVIGIDVGYYAAQHRKPANRKHLEMVHVQRGSGTCF